MRVFPKLRVVLVPCARPLPCGGRIVRRKNQKIFFHAHANPSEETSETIWSEEDANAIADGNPETEESVADTIAQRDNETKTQEDLANSNAISVSDARGNSDAESDCHGQRN